MPSKIGRYLPAIVAWLLLLGVTGAFYYLVIPGFVAQFKIAGVIFSILEMLLFISVVANFLIATVIDPGVVPTASETEEQQQNEFRAPLYKNAEINGISVRMKWCTTCHFYRPPRCSHCSVCDHCIDSFDHHCPWLNNCIGRRNYRYFFIFLLTLTVHIICIFFFCFFYTLRTKADLLTKENIGSMIIMVVSGIVFMPVIGLTSFHLFLVATGRTTNEQVTGKYRSGYNPFNKGFCQNIAIVCFGSQFPRFSDYVGRQEVPDLDNLTAARECDVTTSTAAPGVRSHHKIGPALSTAEPHQVHLYTPEHEHQAVGSKKHGHDGFVEYKPLKKQPLDLLKGTTSSDTEDRVSAFGDMSRESSMITIRRFPKNESGVGDDDSILGVDAQGSKCNLLDENGSALEAPVVNVRRGASSASSGGDVEACVAGHDHERARFSSPGNERYQQMLKEAYSGANVRDKLPSPTGGALKNGPTDGGDTYGNQRTNVTRPIAGAPRFAYVPPSSLQSAVVNKSRSMDAVRHNLSSSPAHGGQPLVHSSVPPRLAAADCKRPLSFTQAVQLHDSLTQSRVGVDGNLAASGATAAAAVAGKRSASGAGNNVNEIRV